LLSRAQLSASQGILLAVYRTSCWQEFDDLFLQDPLRDISHYSTPALTPLLEDRDSDKKRYEDHKDMFFAGKDDSFLQKFNELRAMSNQPPHFFGATEYQKPTNPPVDFDRGFKPGDRLQIFLQGVNPTEYITQWDDAKKLIHHEKVMWWHDYMATMIADEKVSHAWGTNDFCFDSGVNGNSASAVAIYSVKDYEEFNQLYSLDPIRRDTVFWSILLQPIADQRRIDTERLKREIARKERG
jgi:hypothetical protein